MLMKYTKPKKRKLTPEQKVEQRLWKNAEAACKALCESFKSELRLSNVTYSQKHGLSLGMTYNVAFEIEAPSTWTVTSK